MESPQSPGQQIRSVADLRGKHRISAELKRLEQETRFLEEEVVKLDRMEKASGACKEMLKMVETRADPLLPQTNGPINPSWDRWFEGPHRWFEGPQDASGCRCLIL